VRIFVVVILLATLLAYWLKSKVPDLEFDWGTTIAESFGFFILLMTFIFGILFAIPPLIQITPRGVSCQQGQSVRRRNRADIRSLTIDTTNPTGPVLFVESVKKPLVVGIASKVSLPDLITFMQDTFPELFVIEKR
jgi:hypothetical protein